MAMVTAIRNGHKIKVSRSAYETLFKPKGYKEVSRRFETVSEAVDEPKEVESDVKEEVDINEIPISEMTKTQLMQYAQAHGIDTSGANNVAQARKIIQRHVREQKM